MSKQTLPTGQDNVIVRNQEVYGFLPKDVIDRLGDTSTQLATEDQTALGAINELKSNLTDFKNGEIIYENSTVYSGDMNLLKSVEDYKAITLILRATGSSLPANLYQGSSMFVPKEVFTDSSINNQGFKIFMFGGTSVYADANLKFNGNKINITQGSHAGWTYIIVYKIIGYK